eukprot:9421782-Pyramimonas_sp.AAC.1
MSLLWPGARAGASRGGAPRAPRGGAAPWRRATNAELEPMLLDCWPNMRGASTMRSWGSRLIRCNVSCYSTRCFHKGNEHCAAKISHAPMRRD